jgi:hypothetical protein
MSFESNKNFASNLVLLTLSSYCSRFFIPKNNGEDVIYFAGNSLASAETVGICRAGIKRLGNSRC